MEHSSGFAAQVRVACGIIVKRCDAQIGATLFSASCGDFKGFLRPPRSLLSVHALSWRVSVGCPGHGLCQPILRT